MFPQFPKTHRHNILISFILTVLLDVMFATKFLLNLDFTPWHPQKSLSEAFLPLNSVKIKIMSWTWHLKNYICAEKAIERAQHL